MKNIKLLHFLLKWKFSFAIAGALAFILSAVFSSPYFIPPKYRSTAVVYPMHLELYSQETPTEQMLQLFESNIIFNHIARKFDLSRHYKLDTTSKTPLYDLESKYYENISIKKTQYEAVKIEVMDTDPVKASEIVKEMIDFFNVATHTAQNEKSHEVLNRISDQLEKKRQEVDSVKIALKMLAQQHGVIDYSSQSRELSRAYYRALTANNKESMMELKAAQENLGKMGGMYHELQVNLDNKTREYNELFVQKNSILSDLANYFTYTRVVVHPFPSDKKAYPVRWLIVVFATVASLMLTFIVALIIENWESMKKENRLVFGEQGRKVKGPTILQQDMVNEFNVVEMQESDLFKRKKVKV